MDDKPILALNAFDSSRAPALGGELEGRVRRRAQLSIADVRGAGLYLGVQLVAEGAGSPAPAFTAAVLNGLRDRQVLIGAAGRYGSVLKIRPPLCFSTANAGQLITALDDVLIRLAKAPRARRPD